MEEWSYSLIDLFEQAETIFIGYSVMSQNIWSLQVGMGISEYQIQKDLNPKQSGIEAEITKYKPDNWNRF